MDIEVVDVEALVRDAFKSLEGTVTGRGTPLSNGIHLHDGDAPSRGAIGTLAVVVAPADDRFHEATVSILITAAGKAGGRKTAVDAATALMRACPTLAGYSNGDAKVLWVSGVTGPVPALQSDDRVGYRVDATFTCQQVT